MVRKPGQQALDLDNLYVIDGCSFPGGAVDLAVTIKAKALRVRDRLLERPC